MRTVIQLHRVGEKADWEAVNPKDRNNWQKMAANTYGLATPANIVTLVGAVLVLKGLWMLSSSLTFTPILLIAFGRLADIADGIIADKTGTKSSVGEAFDAIVDKILALATIIVLAANNLVPILLIIVIGLQALLNSLASAYAKSKGKTIHPSFNGKIAAVSSWLSVVLFLLSKYKPEPILSTLGWVLFAVFVCFGSISTFNYFKELNGDKNVR